MPALHLVIRLGRRLVKDVALNPHQVQEALGRQEQRQRELAVVAPALAEWWQVRELVRMGVLASMVVDML